MLFVHGWEGRGSQLAAFAPELVARGFRVVTFDAPGHGDSSLSRASLVSHARALRSIERLVGGNVHAVIGHSVGGTAALLATRFGFSARRFVLLSPPLGPHVFASTFARKLGLDDRVKGRVIGRLEHRYGIPFADLDVRADAARLASPLLVVHDRDDPVVSFNSGATLAQTAPRGRLVELRGLGHRALLRAPTVIAEVVRFVADGEHEPSFAELVDAELFLRNRRWTHGVLRTG